jgi:superfamily II DNA or RNA helicase
VIVEFPAKVRLGLTATPRRKDGMEPVFFGHVGRVLAEAANDAIMVPEVKLVKYIKRYDRNFILRGGTFNRSRWISELAVDPERNWMLAQFILKALRNGRKILGLTDRLEQLPLLNELMAPWLPNGAWVSPYVGKSTTAERIEAESADVILATYPIASEGLDIPDLDTLVFLTPRGDVEQSVGRVQRIVPGKKTPVVVDPIDAAYNYGINLGKGRMKIYIRIGAKIHE